MTHDAEHKISGLVPLGAVAGEIVAAQGAKSTVGGGTLQEHLLVAGRPNIQDINLEIGENANFVLTEGAGGESFTYHNLLFLGGEPYQRLTQLNLIFAS